MFTETDCNMPDVSALLGLTDVCSTRPFVPAHRTRERRGMDFINPKIRRSKRHSTYQAGDFDVIDNPNSRVLLDRSAIAEGSSSRPSAVL